MSPDFSPGLAAVGGALIGLSASILLLLQGRVAGISGVVGGLFAPRAGDVAWRVAFLLGMVGVGFVGAQVAPSLVAVDIDRSPWMVALAGLLVGFGTRLGNGCTSGHGVCGLARMSPRSAASVATFLAVGMAVAVLVGRFTRVVS